MKKNFLLLAILGTFLLGNTVEAKIYYSNVLKSDEEVATPREDSVLTGDSLCEQYKLDAAKKQYEKALKANPKDSNAHNGIGKVYYLKTTSSDMNILSQKATYLALAKKEFETAIKYDPKNTEAYNNLGEIYKELGDLTKAQANYQKALAINPKYSEAISNLAEIDFLRNKLPDAVAKYKKALTYDSKNIKAYLGLAEAYAAQSKFSEALTEANTALSLFPNNAKAQTIFGKIYDAQGNKVAAINSYRKAITIKPENIEPYLAIAEIFQERGDNEFAMVELKNALSLNPAYKEGYLKLADMALMENKPEIAISYYQKVVGDPIYGAYALKGLSKAYFYSAKNSSATAPITSNAEYINAQNSLLKAIDADPKDLQLYLALIRVSKLLTDDNLSQLYLSKIIAKSDYSPISSLIKGEAQLLCDNYEQATQDFTDAIAKVENIEDCIYIGDIFIENHQYDMAQAAFYKALGFDSSNRKAKLGLTLIAKNKATADMHYNLAKSFYKHDEKVSAVEELKQAVAYDPKAAKSQLLLARSYEKIGEAENSLEHYRVYVDLLDKKDKDYKKYTKKIARITKKVAHKRTKPVENL